MALSGKLLKIRLKKADVFFLFGKTEKRRDDNFCRESGGNIRELQRGRFTRGLG